MLLTEYNEVERDEFILKKGMEKGMEKGILSSIFNLMQSSQMTSEQAMKMLLVPESKWAFYIEQLNKLQKSE